MVLENLDRTQWSFAEAHAHVEAVVLSLQGDLLKVKKSLQIILVSESLV